MKQDKSSASRSSRSKVHPKLPETFQTISSTSVAVRDAKIEVPMLVLYGEWLKAVGFPIGSAAVLTTDRRGELALHRFGLGFPRRLYIRAVPE